MTVLPGGGWSAKNVPKALFGHFHKLSALEELVNTSFHGGAPIEN